MCDRSDRHRAVTLNKSGEIMKSILIVITALASPQLAHANQDVVLQGTIMNASGGILDTSSGCYPAYEVVGINLATNEVLDLCTTEDGLRNAYFVDGATKAELFRGKALFLTGTILGKAEVLSLQKVSGVPPQKLQGCTPTAALKLAKGLNVPATSIEYLNGATLGDGANSVEIDLFKVRDLQGLQKVELDAEDCTIRNIEHVNN